LAEVADILKLPFWANIPDIKPLSGGMTNRNFLADDGTGTYVVRLGDDIPVHHISRANELASSIAAHAAGLSPAVRFSSPGIMVMDYVASQALTPQEVRDPAVLSKLVPLIKTCHRKIPEHFRGMPAFFWVFHVVRDYAWTLKDAGSGYAGLIPEFLSAAERMEKAVGPFDIVFGHNDLLAANFLNSGDRYWLIDWDYAGYNTPLFDLGGLASNNAFEERQERLLLELYFEAPVTDQLWHRYVAMKCASLLRETMWSMVSEIHSKIAFDYAAYTAENLARYNLAYSDFQNS
jgi:thiamine kinase-like enzyme